MNPFLLLALPLLLVGCSSLSSRHTQAYPQNQQVQKVVDTAADSAMTSLHPKRMTVVVAEPQTGRILAVAGRQAGGAHQAGDAVSWMYEPGSAFKPVVVVAALDKHAITPRTKINCENGAFKYGGQTIRDHYSAGKLTPEEILAKSSNIGAAKMALLLKDGDYYDAIRHFGFGEKTGIAIAGEIPGIVTHPSRWDALTKPRMSFGQSVAVTPIQLTMAYCALANGGLLMKPVIGSEKPVVVRRVCSTETANRMKSALQNTVSPKGTAPLAKVEGLTVAGKTGTAQAISPQGGYYQDKYITSFAGLFPVDKPKYVVVVVVDRADLPPEKNYGGLVAAPIFADIARKISKQPSP
jgi:cell division protein FtsI/penicillin-binding protein 2